MASDLHWLGKLSKLRLDRAKGDPAPHKPLLLLAVFEMAEQGLIPSRVLPLTPELAFRFCTLWGIVAHRRTQRPDVRLPFHHLQSDGLWSAMTKDGKPSPDNRFTQFIEMTTDFVEFARNPISRELARRLLIAKYFEPAERISLYAAFGMPIPSDDAIAKDAEYKSPGDAKKQGRETRFRLNIVAAYNYSCALTGYRLTTISGNSIVDAAHIHQFADSRNNDVQNGLALCKNAHWLFDNGLWSISDTFQVIVSVGSFSETSPDQKGLPSYHGRRIRVPADRAFWPNPIHLAWHRKHKFQSR